MRHLRAVGGVVALLAGVALAQAASAQGAPDLKGTWVPAEGAHIIDGTSRHHASGTAPVVDADTLDYCYTHVTPTDRAVACGLLVRKK